MGIKEFNKGFGNCIFMNRKPEDVAATIAEKMIKGFGETPTAVKVTPVDELHDKLSLTLGDDGLEGTLVWHKSTVGAHYVLEGLVAANQ